MTHCGAGIWLSEASMAFAISRLTCHSSKCATTRKGGACSSASLRPTVLLRPSNCLVPLASRDVLLGVDEPAQFRKPPGRIVPRTVQRRLGRSV